MVALLTALHTLYLNSNHKSCIINCSAKIPVCFVGIVGMVLKNSHPLCSMSVCGWSGRFLPSRPWVVVLQPVRWTPTRCCALQDHPLPGCLQTHAPLTETDSKGTRKKSALIRSWLQQNPDRRKKKSIFVKCFCFLFFYQSSWISGCRADRVNLSSNIVYFSGKHG